MARDLSNPHEVVREVCVALGRTPADLDDKAMAELGHLVSGAQARNDHARTYDLALLSVALALQRNDRNQVGSLTTTAGAAAEKLGIYDEFATTLRALLRAAIERLKAGNIEGLETLRSVALALASTETARGCYDTAAQLITEVQDYCDRLRDRYGRFLCLVLLAENAYFAKDAAGMRDYALALSQAKTALPSMGWEARQHASEVLFHCAAHVYAASEYQVAKRLLDRALTILPDDGQLHLWSGHCEHKLSRDDAALAHYEHAARVMPNFASIHLSLSGLYLRLKDFDRSLVACDRSIALSPQDERGHWNRAASLIGKERYAEAIVALKKVIELCGAAAGGGAAEASSGVGATLPWLDDTISHASMAQSLLLECYVQLGDLAQAETHARSLSLHALDPKTKAAAFAYLAQDTDYLAAVANLTEAIGQAPTIQHYRCERADLYLRHGDVDKALHDFEVLLKAGPSEQTAQFVADHLSRIIAEQPANAQARRLHAFMLHKTGHNRPAEQELSRAIELNPNDAEQSELYYLRGICRIATSIDKGRLAFPSPESVTAGALDLARAVKLSNGNPAMVDALLWVIDHTAPDQRSFSFWFNSFVQQHENIFPQLLPELVEPFVKIYSALEHAGRDEREAAVDAFRSAKEPLRRLGRAFLAHSLDVHIADSLVGLQQYREAEECLRGFDPLRWIRPLSSNLQHFAKRAGTAIDIGTESPIERESRTGWGGAAPAADREGGSSGLTPSHQPNEGGSRGTRTDRRIVGQH